MSTPRKPLFPSDNDVTWLAPVVMSNSEEQAFVDIVAALSMHQCQRNWTKETMVSCCQKAIKSAIQRELLSPTLGKRLFFQMSACITFAVISYQSETPELVRLWDNLIELHSDEQGMEDWKFKGSVFMAMSQIGCAKATNSFGINANEFIHQARATQSIADYLDQDNLTPLGEHAQSEYEGLMHRLRTG